ncbi:MAG: hypothetical protein DCF23_00545 [Cyanobium sp.]|nr:MAG: hypothetical protein DCF23_00545 [Cyanobium sp.]
MDTNTAGRDPALLALVAAAAAIEALALLLRPLLVHALALGLTVAGWRPSCTTAAPEDLLGEPAPSPTQPAPTAPTAAAGASSGQLEALPVRELRQLARAAGHRALARSGRRQQLLEVLA